MEDVVDDVDVSVINGGTDEGIVNDFVDTVIDVEDGIDKDLAKLDAVEALLMVLLDDVGVLLVGVTFGVTEVTFDVTEVTFDVTGVIFGVTNAVVEVVGLTVGVVFTALVVVVDVFVADVIFGVVGVTDGADDVIFGVIGLTTGAANVTAGVVGVTVGIGGLTADVVFTPLVIVVEVFVDDVAHVGVGVLAGVLGRVMDGAVDETESADGFESLTVAVVVTVDASAFGFTTDAAVVVTISVLVATEVLVDSTG